MPKREESVQNNLHIANNGYTYEGNLLYFPLYPLMVNVLSNSVSWITKDLVAIPSFADHSSPSMVLFSSVILNAIFFIFATDRLYYLSRKVLK